MSIYALTRVSGLLKLQPYCKFYGSAWAHGSAAWRCSHPWGAARHRYARRSTLRGLTPARTALHYRHGRTTPRRRRDEPATEQLIMNSKHLATLNKSGWTNIVAHRESDVGIEYVAKKSDNDFYIIIFKNNRVSKYNRLMFQNNKLPSWAV